MDRAPCRPDPDHPLTSEKPTSKPARPSVLVVTEDDLYARVVGGWLAKRGWQVARASVVTEARDVFTWERPAVALVDLDDDTYGAFELLAAVQQLPGRQPRIVAVTRDLGAAHLSQEIKTALGIAAVAVRPCHIEAVGALLAHAAQVVDKNNERPPLAPSAAAILPEGA